MLGVLDRAPVAAGAVVCTPEIAALRHETLYEVFSGGSHVLEPHRRRVEVLSNRGQELAQFLSEPGVGELFGRKLAELSSELKHKLR